MKISLRVFSFFNNRIWGIYLAFCIMFFHKYFDVTFFLKEKIEYVLKNKIFLSYGNFSTKCRLFLQPLIG